MKSMKKSDQASHEADVEIEEVEAVFRQRADSAKNNQEDFNCIKIQLVDAGGGYYAVIETSRWAIDDPVELTNMIESLHSLVRQVTGLIDQGEKR